MCLRIICFLFFTVFGASAIYLQNNNVENITRFATLQHYPLGFILSMLTLIVIAIFFITSADSATYVLRMLTTKGSISPPSFVKVR